MKVVHISTSTSGGAGIAAYRLHENLLKHTSIDSSLIQRTATSDNQAKIFQTPHNDSYISKIRRRLNIHPEHYNWKRVKNYPRNYSIATFPVNSYRLDRHPLIQDADIIHLHWIAEFLDYPSFFKKVKKPIVWTLHDLNPFNGIFHFNSDRENNKDSLGKLDLKTQKQKAKYIRQAKNLNMVYLSSWMKNQAMHSDALYDYPFNIIPNGLNFEQYSILDKDLLKKELSLENGLKTMLVVGTFLDMDQKGFPLLFSVLNEINRVDFNFITIGEYPNNLKLDDRIKHIHIDKIADVPELNKYYSAADLTIIPSREDNLPNIMLESFANGTPIMTFPNGGMAEHMDNGNNGILIDEMSENKLAEAIHSYLNNKPNFNQDAIRKYALEYFSSTVQVQDYLELYKSILNK